MNYRESINETLGRPLDKLCVEMGKEFVKDNDKDTKKGDGSNQRHIYLTKERLEETCDSLRQQRDNLVSEVQRIIVEFIPCSRQAFSIYFMNNLILYTIYALSI